MSGPPEWAPACRAWLFLAFVFAASAASAGQEPVARPDTAQAKADPTAFSVYVLSRGRGVPARSLEALRKVADVVEADRRRGVRVETRRIRIGLEGETRFCVDYVAEPDARRALKKIEKLVRGVDLVNLVPGACPAPEKGRPEKEDRL